MVCFALAIVACGWLWQRHGGVVHGIGQVDALRVDVTSPGEGLLVALPRPAGGQWSLYDHLEAGDVVARFDDRPLQVDRNLLRQDVRQLVDQIDSWQAAPAGDADAAIERFLKSERMRLEALDQRLAGQPPALATTAADVAPDDGHLPDSVPAATRSALERLREARESARLRCEELTLRIELLEVRAPISGTLVAVDCWPGQSVPEGRLIATIAADHGRHIISYLPEDSRIEAQPGTQVAIAAHGAGGRRMLTEVERVGRQYERIPSRYERDSTTPRWGLPVRIKMPADALLRPGALVDVTFLRGE